MSKANTTGKAKPKTKPAKATKPAEAKKINSVTLTYGGKTLELPVMHGSEGPSVIDVRKLYAETGMFTYDPGFTSTASCDSKITYIDGDAGILRHRGYSIDELAIKSDFMETSYLLLEGELPNKKQKEKFVRDITMHTMLHEQIINGIPGLPARQPPHGRDVRCGRRPVRVLS